MPKRKKQIPDIIPCPICSFAANVRSLKANNAKKFYCSECAVEFYVQKNKTVKVYEVSESGKSQLIKTILPTA